MKKDVSEERTFCDFHTGSEKEELADEECLICHRDICRDHRVVLQVYLDRQDRNFRAALCPIDGKALLPVLKAYQGKSETWRQAGHNPDFNEAQLQAIINFLSVIYAFMGEGQQ